MGPGVMLADDAHVMLARDADEPQTGPKCSDSPCGKKNVPTHNICSELEAQRVSPRHTF